MRVILFVYLVFGGFICFSQQPGHLQVTLQPDKGSGSNGIYNVTIKNASDSVACILHSMFVNLTSDQPQGLPLHFQKSPKRFYSLGYSTRDTTFQYESTPYRGECILPFQSLHFKIKLVAGDEAAERFCFEYVYLSNFCYNSFVEQTHKMTTWYVKYKRNEKTIELPN